MAHRIVSNEDFYNRALDLFRTYGFDGVSLQRLAEATGLEKASLYYRYPGGKDEIALAVAQGVVAWFQANVFDPLTDDTPPRKRVAAVADNLRTFYAGGKKSCVTDVLSLPGGSDALRAGLKGAMQAWIKAFAGIARECGFSPSAAKARAEETIIRIEGSLVLARVLGDNSTFERTMKLLPDLLTAE
ncbi:TetR/AcrR family transcriptional regulator [Acidicapsa ligni]|uniref:TetR/AcrR family transcriptional regulator n=1 Tax=Acidicapsa ligni TaxID=542300 RepID=UPI0021DFF428|nr:TetR/AcrR family transcriptional regulator [Acidicapsa ligni]